MVYYLISGMFALVGALGVLVFARQYVLAARREEDYEYFDELYLLKPDEEEINEMLLSYVKGLKEGA